MPNITSLIHKITSDYPYAFIQGGDFRWSPDEAVVYFPALETDEDVWSLLHEIAHAELRHHNYTSDIQLIQHEAHAWDHALTVVASRYNITIDQDYIEDHMDTYRLWLHERSTCPTCGQNGIQTKNTYSCLNCRCVWRTNEARLCALRRVKLRDQNLI